MSYSSYQFWEVDGFKPLFTGEDTEAWENLVVTQDFPHPEVGVNPLTTVQLTKLDICLSASPEAGRAESKFQSFAGVILHMMRNTAPQNFKLG